MLLRTSRRSAEDKDNDNVGQVKGKTATQQSVNRSTLSSITPFLVLEPTYLTWTLEELCSSSTETLPSRCT